MKMKIRLDELAEWWPYIEQAEIKETFRQDTVYYTPLKKNVSYNEESRIRSGCPYKYCETPYGQEGKPLDIGPHMGENSYGHTSYYALDTEVTITLHDFNKEIKKYQALKSKQTSLLQEISCRASFFWRGKK